MLLSQRCTGEGCIRPRRLRLTGYRSLVLLVVNVLVAT